MKIETACAPEEAVVVGAAADFVFAVSLASSALKVFGKSLTATVEWDVLFEEEYRPQKLPLCSSGPECRQCFAAAIQSGETDDDDLLWILLQGEEGKLLRFSLKLFAETFSLEPVSFPVSTREPVNALCAVHNGASLRRLDDSRLLVFGDRPFCYYIYSSFELHLDLDNHSVRIGNISRGIFVGFDPILNVYHRGDTVLYPESMIGSQHSQFSMNDLALPTVPLASNSDLCCDFKEFLFFTLKDGQVRCLVRKRDDIVCEYSVDLSTAQSLRFRFLAVMEDLTATGYPLSHVLLVHPDVIILRKEPSNCFSLIRKLRKLQEMARAVILQQIPMLSAKDIWNRFFCAPSTKRLLAAEAKTE